MGYAYPWAPLAWFPWQPWKSWRALKGKDKKVSEAECSRNINTEKTRVAAFCHAVSRESWIIKNKFPVFKVEKTPTNLILSVSKNNVSFFFFLPDNTFGEVSWKLRGSQWNAGRREGVFRSWCSSRFQLQNFRPKPRECTVCESESLYWQGGRHCSNHSQSH